MVKIYKFAINYFFNTYNLSVGDIDAFAFPFTKDHKFFVREAISNVYKRPFKTLENYKKKTLKIYKEIPLRDEFIARCLLMYQAIKSKETILSRTEILRQFKRKKYLRNHSGGGRVHLANIIIQHEFQA